jgi:hypothetical protein
MIYIATVHWQTDKWIDLQLKHLKSCIEAPFKVYAFLNNIPQHHYTKFDYVCNEPVEVHGIKLNLLADIISCQAADDDILIFLDGDAFPVAPLDHFLKETLSQYPLTAIQRKEHLSDIQPHPSFCATTVGFWKYIKGDWKMGYCWQDSTGQMITDTGGNLLKLLSDSGTSWSPMHRTHSLGDHPLWYGVYHQLIYHHGAGFRTPFSLLDMHQGPFWLKFLWVIASKSRSLQVILYRLWERAMDTSYSKKRLPSHDNVYEALMSDEKLFPQAKRT